MTDRRHQLLRPQDATSWDEFQARWVIERARYTVTRRPWRDTGRIAVSAIPGLAAVVLWVAFALTRDRAPWVLLALALVCTALFGWTAGNVLRRRWVNRRRRHELDRLRDQWHARFERGEIPRSSPGGSKVWRDEIPVEVPPSQQPSAPK